MGRPKITKPKVSNSVKDMLSDNSEKIVTPVYNRYMMSHPNARLSQDTAERVVRLLSTPDRDRSGSWSASGAGHCMRRRELQYLGAPSTTPYIGPRLARIYDVGTWLHLMIQARLYEAGAIDDFEVTVKNKVTNSRCTCDGVGVVKEGKHEGKEFGLEIKTRISFAFENQSRRGIDPKTRSQVDFMFWRTGFDLWVILNLNKNTQELDEQVFERDESRVRQVERNVFSLNEHIRNKKLHPMLSECSQQLKGGKFYDCPFGGKGGVCVNTGEWYEADD